jgi:outer membrane protein OmpA-like peptidoglycan-associated protein
MFSLTVMVIVSLTGCSEPNAKIPVALSIVSGNHADTKELNLAGTEIVKKVSAATASYGFISIVCADGNPKLSNAWTISPPSTPGLTESKLKQISTQQAKEILASLLTVKASSPELDTLKALNTSVRSFADAPENSVRQILVLDSGLSTVGDLNFLKSDFLNATPNAAVDLLNSRNAIPDFSGIIITWIGLGDVGAPQKELSPAQKENLKKIWTAIIEKTGGKAIFLDTLPSNNDNPASDYPKVSTIDFLSDDQTNISNIDAVVFRNIQFIGDSEKYIDPKAADFILKPVADYIKATPGFTILIIGTTAGANNKESCMQLSSKRAEAVRNTLISLGASENQIKAIGLGYSDPWHIPDTRDDGTLIESIASQNRKVVLMDASSSEAQSILAENL